MRDKPLSEREMGAQLINETVAYAESSACRRKVILHYFGEKYEASQCDNACDNCRNPKEKIEVKKPRMSSYSKRSNHWKNALAPTTL